MTYKFETAAETRPFPFRAYMLISLSQGLNSMQLNRKCAGKIEKCAVKSYYWCSQFL